MIRNVLSAALGSAAIALAAPAAAGPGGGHGGGANISAGANMNAGAMGGPSQAGINAGVNAQSSINASPNSALNRNTTITTTTTNPAVGVSQGPFHASPNGIAHANQRSVLASGAVSSTALPGLTTGLTVQTSTGTSLGTVSQIVTGTDGSIRLVVVTSPTGQTLRLAPNTLSISGGVVTTTTGG